MSSPDKSPSDRVAALTDIWRTVLGNPALDEDSDLFESRGTSLHVLQITGMIYDLLGEDVKLRDVFSHTSPRSLAELLDAENTGGRTTADSAGAA